ncbi:hypothetical protein PSm6_35030 [Pseudomonas solani]|uniref:MotY N-terminal domain-containing protein n=1 Tax=Pseudomonas solani TaxID=2731552 RepID=A0ABM7LBV5_9PSED|nr:hypothetical protein PSm6_35030 [Pseudomonas solani]
MEPAVVRQCYVALLSLFASLPAMAITFQTRLEKAEWAVEGDKFECRLSQPITDFGSGEFVRRAGEQVTFRLKARERWMGAGSATLLAAAAPGSPDVATSTSVPSASAMAKSRSTAASSRVGACSPACWKGVARWYATAPCRAAKPWKCACCR